jgi:hypothetical protein
MALRVTQARASRAGRLLDTDDASTEVLIALTRKPMSAADLGLRLGIPHERAVERLTDLLDAGRVEESADGTWHARLGQRQRSTFAARMLPRGENATASAMPASPAWLATSAGARVIAAMPLLLALATSLVLIAANVSFAAILSFIGILADMFVGVLLPLVLALSSARSADHSSPPRSPVPPAMVLWLLLGTTLLVLMVYATVIYSGALDRLAALGAVGLAVFLVGAAWRAGALRPCSALVVQVDDDGDVQARAMDAGRPTPADGMRRLPTNGRALALTIPDGVQGPLRVIARSDDDPADALGALLVTWPSGSVHLDSAGDLNGVLVPFEGRSGAVDVRWTLT